jgi:hypothetical protein
MDSFLERLKYGMTTLSGKSGKATSGLADMLVHLESVVAPDNARPNMYMQVLQAMMTGNGENMQQVLDIVKMSEGERQRMKEIAETITKKFAELEALSNANALSTGVKKDSDGTAGGAAGGAPMSGGGYWKDLNDRIKSINATKAKATDPKEVESADKSLDFLAKNNLRHPIFSPETLKATFGDRVIFIAVTFAMRSFALTFLHWALKTRMVNSFEYAIVFYVFVYLLFFAFWVLVVNVSSQDLTLHMIFYYVNLDADSGTGRVWLHAALQLLLLPLPFILRSKSDETQAKLETRDQVRALNMVGKLSFVLWALGAFIALRF